MPVGGWNWTGEVGIIAFDRDLVRVVEANTYPALDIGYTIPVFESTVIAIGELVDEVTSWIAFASKLFSARFCASVWPPLRAVSEPVLSNGVGDLPDVVRAWV
jgi:hypothetical protein